VKAHEAVVALKLDTPIKFEAYARAEANAGRKEMLDFFHGEKNLRAFIKKVEHFESSPELLERSTRPKLDLLFLACSKPCVCDGRWIPAAEEILHQNGILSSYFKERVALNLAKVPKKGLAVFLYGPTTCAKSWLLNPLILIFKCFVSQQAGSSFQLAGLPGKEVVILHEFEMSDKGVDVNTLKLWWGGEPFGIGTSKAFSEENEDHTPTAPIFGTAPEAPYHRNKLQRDMLARRICPFTFWKTIPEEEVKDIPDCPCCFAKWIVDANPGLFEHLKERAD